MATPTLFNLDPTQFALGRSTGRFQQIGEVARQPNVQALNALEQMLAKIQKPTAPTLKAPTTPTAPTNLPTVTPVDPTIGSRVSALQAQLNAIVAAQIASRARGITNPGSYAEQKAYALRDLNRDPASIIKIAEYNEKSGGKKLAEQQRAEAAYIQNFQSLKASALAAQNDPSIAKHNSSVTAYNAAIAPFKAEADKYKKDATAYNAQIDVYKKGIDTYNKTREGYTNQFQADQQKNAVVNKQSVQAEGEQLAATDLYSDSLHQQMIEKVGAANAEPTEDIMTTLYSGSGVK